LSIIYWFPIFKFNIYNKVLKILSLNIWRILKNFKAGQ
jgi:hypothetical protein